MTPEELAAIRERDAALDRHQEHRRYTGLGEMRPLTGDLDRRALLAHIDAITEAVERLPGYRDPRYSGQFEAKGIIDRAAVLALLRGTPQR